MKALDLGFKQSLSAAFSSIHSLLFVVLRAYDLHPKIDWCDLLQK